MILRWALHFASGNSLFSGVLVLLAVWSLATFTKRRRNQRTLRLAVFVGVVMIALSATPFPWWAYAIWGTLFGTWLWTARRPSRKENGDSRASHLAGGVFVTGCVLAVGLELTTLFPPIPPGSHQTMYVIGDSITAGLNDDDLLWPTILADSKHVDVVNLAQPGAMADSAMKQAQLIPDGAGGIVLIEIGGNDMLSGRNSSVYGQDLKTLIGAVSTPNRTLVMLELPLAPFSNEYGCVQRRLAREYDVLLISKREFSRVLGMADGTVDGIHLSARGQQLMADTIWKYVGPLYATQRPFAAGG